MMMMMVDNHSLPPSVTREHKLPTGISSNNNNNNNNTSYSP